VKNGRADAGLGLRATASRLDLGFVPLGVETVRVLALPDRLGKNGLQELAATLADIDSVLADLDGYQRS